jgi:hypothetical protein
MKLAYFVNHCALNSREVLTAFLSSCTRAGITVVENSLDADAAVIWSVTWSGRMAKNHQIYQHYRGHGRPVIILEVGALIRGTTWKVALNNITADGYYGHQHNLDPARPAKLKLLPQSKFQPKPTVLIVAQNHQSLQVCALPSMDQWITDTVQQVRQHTDRPLILRPHPRSRLNLAAWSKQLTIETPKKLPMRIEPCVMDDIEKHIYKIASIERPKGKEKRKNKTKKVR